MLLGTLGKRETEDGHAACPLDPAERSGVKRQVRGVMAKSIIVAVLVTAVVVAV